MCDPSSRTSLTLRDEPSSLGLFIPLSCQAELGYFFPFSHSECVTHQLFQTSGWNLPDVLSEGKLSPLSQTLQNAEYVR